MVWTAGTGILIQQAFHRYQIRISRLSGKWRHATNHRYMQL